ncbi:MAG TPA: carbohydrate-binding domain-containing protein [Ruminococcus flavefaciens]|nr:carbohydrate-binding domain-containing protein [Ruminococcus flavefaciens]
MKKSNMKKIFAGLSAACVIASALPVAGTAISAAAADIVYGDANCDGTVDISDAVIIMQSLSNPSKYGSEGSDSKRITAAGKENGDVFNRGDGITNKDALSIQKKLLNLIDKLPESVMEGSTSTTTTSAPVTTTAVSTTSTSTDPAADITYIHLKGSSITVDGNNATVSGTTVTISHSGTYMIDGTLDDGQINVNIPDETVDAETVKLFLNGVNITGKSAPAILITNAENTSINLVDGSANTISDGDTAYAGDYLGAAVIEAKDDLTIKGGDKGTGTLTVTANTQDGISCNNDIKLTGGVINVTTLNATDKTDAVKGKKSVTVKGGTVTVDAEGDGIKSSQGAVAVEGGNISIKAGNDAVQAETTIDISGGTLIAGGDRGLTAVTAVNITGGNVYATATDNQVDEKLLTGTTQTTVLLNCKDDATNEKDGTWKKANAIVPINTTDVEFTKKFKYVLVSTSSINGAKSCEFINASTSTPVTHTDGSQTQFQLGIVTVFNNVDPSGSTITPPSTDTPEQPSTDVTTDGYTITLGSAMATNASAEVASVANNVCTIKQPGVFTVTGEMTGGQIVVDVDKTAYPDGVVELALSGMSLTNTSDSPIYVASIGDEVVISAKNGTENTISDGTSYTNADSDTGAIYSKDDIKFKGKGTLTVNGNAADAIVGKDDVKIYNGNLIVNAKDDGIRGKDSVTIGNTSSDGTEVDYSNLSVKVKTEGGDGIKATSTEASSTAKQVGIVTINGGAVNIDSYADGISAEQFFVMNGGDLNIKTYQGSGFTGSAAGGNTGGWGGGFGGMGMDGNANKTDISAKGIKAVGLYDAAGTTWQSVGNIDINGGNITIDSSDDAVHCGGSMNLYGGTYTIASADDGFHSDHELNIGKTAANTFDDVQIYISKCYEGIEGVTINQNSGTVYIISGDDGYNAAGGADGSGFGNTGGGWGGGMMSSSTGTLNINGGLVVVNSANGDHDAIDSNGDINLNGGYVCANSQEPLDCGDSGNTINYKGGSVITMTAGNTNLSQRYSFVDNSGNVIVSFISASGNPGQNCTNCTAQSGGTVSGGKTVNAQSDKYSVTVGGTISGATQITAAASSGGGMGGPGGRQPGQPW